MPVWLIDGCVCLSKMKSLIQSDENCLHCGGEVIYWYPDTIEFADLWSKVVSSITGRSPENPLEPQSPGKYCLKGCFAQAFNLDSTDFWNEMERNRAARENASILIELTTPATISLDAIKLYLDRYIRRTALSDAALPNCEYIELEPGTHTLIARDYDHQNPNRRESNLIEFTIGEKQRLTFYLSDEDGVLKLAQNAQSVVGT